MPLASRRVRLLEKTTLLRGTSKREIVDNSHENVSCAEHAEGVDPCVSHMSGVRALTPFRS